ncbi:MAG: zf-HC2 domain-containing protein [Candidatus Omnitrophota bacterium]
MECKKIQDRLMTDYVDQALDPAESAGIERHLTSCPHCREFLEGVRQTAVMPFKEAEEMKPEDAVWVKIQERIEAERRHSWDWFGGLAESLAPFFRISAPIFRAAFVTAMILVIVIVAKWPSSYADPVYGYISEQMTFMNGLQTGNTELLNGDLKDDELVFEEMTAG